MFSYFDFFLTQVCVCVCREQGACRGICARIKITVPLLVLEGANDYKFDEFDIPGYCACKNIVRSDVKYGR